MPNSKHIDLFDLDFVNQPVISVNQLPKFRASKFRNNTPTFWMRPQLFASIKDLICSIYSRWNIIKCYII